jgi:uncharacterized membrane protein
MSHALGTFTATFLYAIAALAGVDRSGSGQVPIVSLWVVVILLVASVGMFIGLIQRIGVLQVNRVLMLMGDQGRKAITRSIRHSSRNQSGNLGSARSLRLRVQSPG